MAILVLTEPIPSAPFVAALRALAGDVPVWTEADAPPPEAVQAILAWRLRPGVLPRYPALKVLCAIGAGVEKLLVADLPPQVVVTRVVDPQQSQAIARWVLAHALQHLGELPRYRAQQARGEWLRHPNRPLAQCRIGLLGLGEIGRAVAQGAAALGLPVAGWSRHARELPGVQVHVGAAGLPSLLARSDVLVNALPLTAQTSGLLSADLLRQLPQGAFVINVGRGGHLVEDDLKALLDSGHLGGAALDVFAREPLPADHWIWQHPQVMATPHVAGAARDEVVAAACLDALARARDGRPQPLAVDRAAGY